MFQLIPQEYEVLRSQFVTLNDPSAEARGGRRYGPLVFTENGVTMLSTVLNGQRAIQVNIAIMRIFTKLRSFLMLEKGLTDRMDKLEASTSKMFKIVFERLDDFEDQITPHLPENRRKIGLDDRKKKDKNLTVRIYSSYLTL
jgi:hypothetical protein